LNTELISEVSAALPANGSTETIQTIDTELLSDIETNNSKIIEHGAKASAIVNKMIEHGEGESLEMEPIDANELVRSAVNSFESRLTESNISVKLDLDKKLPVTMIDAKGMSRVFENLIRNSVDSIQQRQMDGMNTGGTIGISSKSRQNKIILAFSDDGTGLGVEAKNRLFEPFFTTKETGKGTGLGLSISYEIVTMGHGGEIHAKDKPGKGAEFIIELPIAKTSSNG